MVQIVPCDARLTTSAAVKNARASTKSTPTPYDKLDHSLTRTRGVRSRLRQRFRLALPPFSKVVRAAPRGSARRGTTLTKSVSDLTLANERFERSKST